MFFYLWDSINCNANVHLQSDTFTAGNNSLYITSCKQYIIIQHKIFKDCNFHRFVFHKKNFCDSLFDKKPLLYNIGCYFVKAIFKVKNNKIYSN